MSKSRNKKNTKQNATPKPMQSVNIRLPETMSAVKMQHIIAGAIVEAEKIKAQNEKEKRQSALAEWHMTIGYQEHNNKIKKFFNEVKVFKNILFLNKEHIEGNIASSALLKSFIILFFWIMKWCSLFLAILLICGIPVQYFMDGVNQFPWQLYTYCLPFAFLAFVFSRLFRMAGVEIDKLDDRNYLFSLFASITSLVSIIIAVIAIIKEA